MNTLKGSCETLSDFRRRGLSPIFSSLRPKREKKDGKKKIFGSKSIFSTLMLANIEDRMYFDPSGSIESVSLEEQKKKLRKKLDRKKIEKPKNIPEVVISSPNDTYDEVDGDDEKIDDLKPVSHILLNVDSFIYEIYEDVLYNILHHLNRDDNQNHDNDDENDQPPIESDSAFTYVRDAFGINLSKHVESMEKVKAISAPETNISDGENEAQISNGQSFCMLTPKVKNFENIESHCVLLQILLKHEIESSKIPVYFWKGKFNFLATKVLSLHADFRFIEEPHLSFAKWAAYIEIHQYHSLSLDIFYKLLDNIVDVYKDESESTVLPVQRISLAANFMPACLGFIGNNKTGMPEIAEEKNRCSDHLKTKEDEVVKLFWNSAYKLQDSFLNFIHNLHYKTAADEDIIKILILKKSLEIVRRIDKIFLPRDIEDRRFVELMKISLRDGAIEHLMKNVNQKNLKQAKYNDKRLEELIRVIRFIQEHFKQFIEEFGHVFVSSYNIKFSEMLYKVYDTQLAFIIKPIVLEISNTKEGNIDNFAKEEEAVAVKLFELYRELKKFSDYGMEAYGNYEFETKDYSNWFSAGIDKWCKVSVFSAMSRIEKSIEIDNIKPAVNDAKYSSSAIDTIQILYSVKQFWVSLQWPDSNKETELIKHIVADLSRFATIYFNKFSNKVQNIEAMRNAGIFKVPLQVSVAIANFNYIADKMQILIEELTKGKITDSSSVQKFVGSTLKCLQDTTYELLNNTLKKCIPTIKKLMLEGGEEGKAMDVVIADRLMTYVEDMLSTLHDDLPNREFELAKMILWQDIVAILSELIQSSISEKMPPEFFTNLRRIFTILKQIFQCTAELTDDDAMIKKIERLDYLLECYGLNTSRLIHQYYKDRYEMQQQINKTPFNPYGILTIYCYFIDNLLRLEILNARNLIPIGPNRKCDSFIKVHIIPDKYFPTCQNNKTKVQQNTHFPLYDEVFEYTLTREQRNMKDAIIYFNIKDKYLIGSNECLAEAFLSFKNIPEFVHKDKMQQIHLTLTRLQSDDFESLRAIHHRSQAGDKDAKEFLTKLRSRTLLSPKKLKIPVTQL